MSGPELSDLLQLRRWPRVVYGLCVAMISLLWLTQSAALAQVQVQGASQQHSQATAGLAPKGLVPELSLYVDPTSRMGVQDASRQVFTPFKFLLNRSIEPIDLLSIALIC